MPSETVAFHTLGCKLNYSETSSLSRTLEQDGFTLKTFEEPADIYVLNTCSVTENADKECRHLIRRIKRRSPQSKIVITGCYAQLKSREIAGIAGVDLVLGTSEKFNLASRLKELTNHVGDKICSCDIHEVKEFQPAWSLHDRTRTFLKVQDGCDYSCSFCTIPTARGQSRSGRIGDVVRQARELAGMDIKEIVLTGINLGDFGKNGLSSAEKEDFYQLIQELDKVEGISRFRISSIEPNLLSEDIICFVAASEKFMPHFHIPLQSGNNRILGLMRRRYTRELYASKLASIRKAMPHCCIGADIITGFPSETQEDFQETLQFLEEQDISYLHVFTYSERSETAALQLSPVVPVSERQARNNILRRLSHQKMQDFTCRNAGQTRSVLFERASSQGMMEGFTDNYIRISVPYRKEWVNKIVDWVL
ncbi:MAG TPA: tRNA (N(6)-L-threonylcarbamoyladenosine(37)-C(2))-methylthiotransferase MtaB [Chitinophagaceae bacterium]|nr:tRNA (N(6)-L-threonylcarbamoyladenosine(37)-C(2))-methylthiotransferase MtaB [Chitinophagaceae bacterium]